MHVVCKDKSLQERGKKKGDERGAITTYVALACTSCAKDVALVHIL